MVRLNALGQSSIEIGDVRIGPEQPYLFAIALYLIVERGKKIPRQVLVDLIWPQVTDEKHARQRFRQALLRLREFGVPIVGDNGTLLIEKSAAQTDFEGLASPEAIRPGQSLEFLPHYAPRISDLFLDWVETQRSRVHAGVQRVFLLRMQQARSRGDWGEVDAVASECLRLDPYNEEAVMAHAECAVMRGSKREALTILDGYMESLGSHVGTIGLPAKILRTRIAERLTDQRYAMISEQHFVGREASMELLQGLLRDAQRRAGSAAFIWGEPGIGKSRLVQELTQVASLEGARVVSTKCHPTDAGRPLSAFADLVPVLKTLPGALGCSAQTLSLLQRLTDRNRSEAFPTQEAGDAAFLAATIRRAVFDLVDAVADEGMLIMVIEDVHWLDEPSWAILSAMVEWSTTRTLLILMTSRTSYATEGKVADPDRGLHRHHLLPLPDAQSGALLDKLIATDVSPLPDSVRTWSVEAAEGNPYYLRELVRHWAETQQIFGVPRSLAELIEARLNRLSSLALRVMQLCAAFGKHSTFERLEKASGYQNHVLLDAIEELSFAAMLATDKAGITVRHDLLGAAALARLGDPAVKLVHRQVAFVLESEISEQHTAALMWDCAVHWQAAGEIARALGTVQLCAKHLHSAGQAHLAVELYEKTLPICSSDEERLNTLVGLAVGLKAADGWLRLDEVIRDAESLAMRHPGNVHIADQLYLLRLETGWRLHTESRTRLPEITSFAFDKAKQPRDRLQAVRLGLTICADNCQEAEAQFLFGLLDQLDTDHHPGLAAHIRMIFHTDFGDMDQALSNAEALLAFEEILEEAGSRVRAWTNVATCYRRAGRITQAKSLCKRTYDFCVEHRLTAHAARAATSLAFLALQEEDIPEATQWLCEARKYVTDINERRCVDSIDYIAARISLHTGDIDAATSHLRLFLDASPSQLHRQSVAAVRSEVRLARNEKPDPAELAAMLGDFENYDRLGLHDFIALSLYRALIANEDLGKARSILVRFVTSQRRELGPLLPSLKKVVDGLYLTPQTANDTGRDGVEGAPSAADSRGGALTNN